MCPIERGESLPLCTFLNHKSIAIGDGFRSVATVYKAQAPTTCFELLRVKYGLDVPSPIEVVQANCRQPNGAINFLAYEG
jgi:hypothetical protein